MVTSYEILGNAGTNKWLPEVRYRKGWDRGIIETYERKFLQVMEILIIWIVVMISQIYIRLELNNL